MNQANDGDGDESGRDYAYGREDVVVVAAAGVDANDVVGLVDAVAGLVVAAADVAATVDVVGGLTLPVNH